MNWEQANQDLEERRKKAFLGGGEAKIQKQHDGGKLTARERLELLFDKVPLWRRMPLWNPGSTTLTWIREEYPATAL